MGRLSKLVRQDAPVFLPNKHPFTQMLIIEAHKESGHSGVAHTLCRFKGRFWTEKGRLITKRALREGCYHCRKFASKPFRLPNMAQPPLERLVTARPFQRIGVDCASPFKVRTRGKETEKQWICLVTCLTTSADHLETVDNLLLSAFLEAYNPFTARRDKP